MLKLFKNNQHKRHLLKAFSNCFNALKDELGNVPVKMQSSHEITGSVLGSCRGYAIANKINESHFNLIVDAVFEEFFVVNLSLSKQKQKNGYEQKMRHLCLPITTQNQKQLRARPST